MATWSAWQVSVIRQGTKLAVWLYRLSGGAIGGTMGGRSVLLLTTTGRKTGRAWTVPLVYGRDKDRLVIIAAYAGSDRHPAWWLNLRDTGRARVQLGKETFDVIPREADNDERERLWATMVQVYPTYDRYATKTRRRLPVVVLEHT